MNKMIAFIKTAVISLGLSISSLSSAAVITFDDLPHWTDIGNHYSGLNWTNLYTMQGSLGSGGYKNAVVSGQNATFNGGAADALLVSGGLFDFNGAYLTAAWNDGLSIKVTGSKSGLEVYSQTVTVNTSGPTWFNFNFSGVDALRFDSFGGTANAAFVGTGAGEHFSMDNFTFNEAVKSVPESSSLMLAMLGLAGLFGARKIKR
jgi:hypothetical protein